MTEDERSSGSHSRNGRNRVFKYLGIFLAVFFQNFLMWVIPWLNPAKKCEITLAYGIFRKSIQKHTSRI